MNPKNLVLGSILSFVLIPNASASIVVFQNDLAGFDTLVGVSETFDFDGIATGTDLSGSSTNGMTFSNPDGNSLEVVAASDTFTTGGFSIGGGQGPADFFLIPTSGQNVLSPGGIELVPGPALGQKDTLVVEFDSLQSAFGIDILFQSLDGVSNMSFELANSALGTTVASGSIDIDTTFPGPQAPGTHFLGIVSTTDSSHFDKVTLFEFDDNNGNPDSNIGFDTVRTLSVPAPSSVWIFALCLLLARLAPFARKYPLKLDH